MTVDTFIRILFFVLGAIVGSFLNVCIVRLAKDDPKERSIVTPRSHCVHCKKTIGWYDNIPLISYFLLRGRCRFCREKISPRYFIVEFLTAVSFVVFYERFGFEAVLWPYLVLLAGLIISTFVDLEHRIIPDEVSVGGTIVGFVLSAFIPALHPAAGPQLGIAGTIAATILTINLLFSFLHFRIGQQSGLEAEGAEDGEGLLEMTLNTQEIIVFLAIAFAAVILGLRSFFFLGPHILSLGSSLIGALIGGGSIYLMGLIGDILFRKESMGGGDVKLMAMVGAFLGWKLALLAFFLAPFFGAVFGIIVKLRTKESLIPYGPFLALGTLLALFFSEPIILWIMSGYGLYR